MSKLKKIAVIIMMLFMGVLFSSFSYASTKEEVGQSLANFTKNFYDNYKQDVIFESGYDYEAKKGLTIDGKYKFDNYNFIDFVIESCLYAESAGVSWEDDDWEDVFSQYQGDKVDDGVGYKIKNIDNLKPGDICQINEINGWHYEIYIGNGETIFVTSNSAGLNNGLNKKKLDNNTECCIILRITDTAAKKINIGNITEIFDGDYEDEYGRYYGTTEGRYVGSYNIISWLFNQFVGFMDYLFGIIAYILRAPFVGWANIIEEMIDSTIVNIQGVKVEDTGSGMDVTESPDTIEDRDTDSVYKPVANDKLQEKTVDTSSRVNIEDIIYNNIPILDVNIFDVNLDKFVNDGKVAASNVASSPVVLLRKNVAIWYYSIRNVTIVIMLLILVYLGIRVAIASVGEKKAQYKELIKAWLIGFAVIFLIHYFMILVVEINETLVDIFHDALSNQLQAQGSESLYDTVRTRAYSFKLSEGVPATIIYMVLIYFLIRFLFIYVKRYFTINILALMGPIIGAKYAYDKIQKGRTSSLSNWMFDFAMNVLLQTVHAMLYSVFMIMAFEISTTSIPGFVLALVMLNFIFKAEDIFLKVFKFDDRSSSIRDVRENKNYFAEAFKVTTGIAYFSRAIPEYGLGFIKGTASYLGTTAGLAGQVVTSGVNTVSWAVRNRNTDIRDLAQGKGEPYKHGDFVGTVKNVANKVGAGVTGKLDDALYKVSNVRSLKLGLGRMKLQDPERYKATKSLLDKNKKLKRQVLKRQLGSGIKSVSTMAKLMGSIPMLVVDPGSGFTMLSTTVGDLKDMAKNEPYYGHMTRKQIRSRRGRVAATLLLGTPMIAVTGAGKELKQFNKDRKDIRKNEEILGNLRRAEVLKSTILKQTALISAQRQLELQELSEEERKKVSKDYDKALEDAIKAALDSVLVGKNIEGAVKDYMIKNKITKLQISDIENLLKDFNLDNIDKQISKLAGIDQRKIDRLQREVDELKEKLKNAAEGVSLSAEEMKKIKTNEEKIAQLTSRIDIIKEVGKKVSQCQGLEDYMLHKDVLENVVSDYIKQKKDKHEDVVQDDIDKMVEIFERKMEGKEHSYTTRERIEEQFGNKKSDDGKSEETKSNKKKFDRKKATSAILESFLEEPEKDNSTKISEDMYSELADMVKELKVLDEQNRVMYGNSGIKAKKFANEIKFGAQKNKKKK